MSSGIASEKHYKVTTTVPCPFSCIDDHAPEYHKVHVYGHTELDFMVTVPCPCIDCFNSESLKAHVNVECVDFWSYIGEPGSSGCHDDDFVCPICEGPGQNDPQIISCGHSVCSEYCWKEYVNRFVPAPPIVTNERHEREYENMDVLLVPDCTKCSDDPVTSKSGRRIKKRRHCHIDCYRSLAF